MRNSLKKIEKDLRALTKRCKNVKYTKALLLSFLLTGTLTLSESLTSPEVKNTENAINQTKKELNASINDMHTAFRQAKRENNRLLKNANLELTQLMEQGDQVVKSPWMSWQFGANYMYSKWNGIYKGKGDKVERYPYEGILKRDEKEFNRYVSTDSKFYSALPTFKDVTSAATNGRSNLGGYGLVNSKIQSEPTATLEISTRINLRPFNNRFPNGKASITPVEPPFFSFTLPPIPVIPETLTVDEPKRPIITARTKAAVSNTKKNVIIGDGSNGRMQSIAVSEGDFKIVRTGENTWNYTYSNYSGSNVFTTGSSTSNGDTANIPTVSANGTWSNLSGSGSGNGSGFQSVVGVATGSRVEDAEAAFLSNGNFLYTRAKEDESDFLGEFVHQAVDNFENIVTQRGRFLNAINNAAGTSLSTRGTDILKAYDDVVSITGYTRLHTWINSGNIVVEGGNTALTNAFVNSSENGNPEQASINTGKIIFQPYETSGSQYKKNTAIFTVSRGRIGILHSTVYNGETGSIENYTMNTVGFISNSIGSIQKVKVINRGDFRFFGEKSAGIYSKSGGQFQLEFVTSDFTLDSTDSKNNTIQSGSYKPMQLFGDESIGYYNYPERKTKTIGNFAVDIGELGKGNQKFSTATTSGKTAGDEIKGLNINPNGQSDFIENSFGIYSSEEINLTSHQIRIYDKTSRNIGVYAIGISGKVNIGGGKILLEGGETAKGNIGIISKRTAEVKSTGSVILNKGIGNMAIFAEEGASSGGGTYNVEVDKVEAKDTKNSILIYSGVESAVKVNEVNIINAGIETDASTTNKKNTAAALVVEDGVLIMNRATKATTPNISITGVKLTDAESYVGFGLMANEGGIIEAQNNYIKVSDGSTAIASIGVSSYTGASSNIDMTGSTVEYKGNGYALYAVDGGKIDMTNSKLILDGNAVGYEKVFGGTSPITTTGMTIHVKSNDVTIMNLRDVTAPLNVSNLVTTLNSWAGLSSTPTYDIGAENYKLAGIDGLSAYNIDQDINKKAVALGTASNNENIFVKNRKLVVQKGKVNLLSGNTVTAILDNSELGNLGLNTVVGLDMNSSSTSTNRNDTQINLKPGSKIIADRVDNGNGAIGTFINYGEVNIDNGAVINVEKSGINVANKAGVGVFSVNGSKVDNKGEINVGGESSIGVLGLSYRTDDKGVLKRDEFGAKPNAGDVVVVNGGKINLDGQKAVGIYIENNDSNKIAVHTIEATNDVNGVITMSGKQAIGMASKLGDLVNKGTINITADQGTGMFVETDNVRTANLINESTGKISIGNSTSESVLRTGMFTKNQNVKIVNKGTIDAGNNSYAIYGKDVQLTSTSQLKIGDNGVGVFTTSTTPTTNNIDIQAGAKFNIGNTEAVGVFIGKDSVTGTTANGVVINDAGSNMTVGNNSYAYVIKGNGTKFTNSATGILSLDTKAVYLYSDDITGIINNNLTLTSQGSQNGTNLKTATGGQNYGLYAAGTVTNNGNIDFSRGVGNVGIYSIKGGSATNNGIITLGDSNTNSSLYSIGMAAGYENSDTGNIVNTGIINVDGKNSIGMYASGSRSTVENATGATINLSGEDSIGIYLDNGAKGINNGTITTVGNPKGAVGIVVRNGAQFTNNGIININSAGGFAFFKANGGIITNYGTFHVGGGATKEFTPGNKSTGKAILDAKGRPILEIKAPAGSPTATIEANGKVQTPVVTNVSGNRSMLTSNIGMYIDTLKGTNPITGSLGVFGEEADLIIGAEAAQTTTSKYVQVPQKIINPYNKTMKANPTIKNWNIYSGSLTWMSTATLDKTSGLINNIYLAKIPYTAYAGNTPTPVEVTDTYNFLDGLEQRYGVEGLGTREKALFNKLNNIGKNEEALFYQATDEMMGHQYANTQQRIYGTGRLLDKEFTHLRKEWDNKSKQSNKIKAFGMRDEYKTDTAGVIDYTSDAYGVAYVHEDETIKLGNSTGWYAGAVHNRFKFKDIGKSKEDTTMLKVGVFKSKAFDHNGSLNWTISGEGYVSRSNMHRKFLVVDEIFNAKSSYYTYGAALKNEISKEFRTSERTSIKPYGSLKLEYGRFGSIKEKTGEVRLEIEGNDYYSVRPEVGVEFKYKQPVAKKTTFVTTLGLGYENELGKVGDVGNRGRVRYTTADWFNIRGEKDDRKGNFKADLNVGVENQRIGVTFNAGYDTKGENIRGGIGFRAIY